VIKARWLVVLAAACSHPVAPVGPDYRAIATDPAPARGGLYADCLADAAANHRFARAEKTLLLFTCTGAPARALYDELAAWSAQVDSRFVRDGQTFRATAKVRHDLIGVDYCAVDHCVITLSVGEFLR